MKTTPRTRSHQVLGFQAADPSGKNADAPRHLQLSLSKIDDPAAETREYLVPMHFVITPGMQAPAGGLAARIPWLQEIRGDRFLSDLHSEVI